MFEKFVRLKTWKSILKEGPKEFSGSNWSSQISFIDVHQIPQTQQIFPHQVSIKMNRFYEQIKNYFKCNGEKWKFVINFYNTKAFKLQLKSLQNAQYNKTIVTNNFFSVNFEIIKICQFHLSVIWWLCNAKK